LRLGEDLGELAMEEAARPVDGRGVPVEDLTPQLLSVERSMPELDLVEVGDDIDPVVARAEAQLLERELLREGPGSRQSRANPVHCVGASLPIEPMGAAQAASQNLGHLLRMSSLRGP